MKIILKLTVSIVSGLVLTMSAGCQTLNLNDLKKVASDYEKVQIEVSIEEEIQIGGNLMSGLLGAAPLVENAELQRYVNDVGFWVASQSMRPDLPWRFGVIDSAGTNAFAAPGGYIVLTIGLFNLLENEAQLAGVLAHEISHVVMKHHLNALNKTMKGDFWVNFGTRLVISNEMAREQVEKLVNAGVQLYAKGLDRRLEYDADTKGVVLAARAGYDPFALLDVLTTIDSINPEEPSLTVMLKTHPPTDDRLNRLAERMDGVLDEYAKGQSNPTRFLKVASKFSQ